MEEFCGEEKSANWETKEWRPVGSASVSGLPRGGTGRKDAARVPPITATIYAEEQSIRVPLLPAVFMTR